MENKQIAQLTNTISAELLGESAIVTEDLSNIVEVGKSWQNVADENKVLGTIADKVGKMVFEDKKYSGRVPSIMKDAWEYGSIMEYISMELPEAQENESYELQDGGVYENQMFYKPVITAKYFNKTTTFEVPMSILTKKQMWPSLLGAQSWNRFLSMIYNAIQNAMQIRMDALIMRTINNLIAETYHADAGAGVKAINVLALYNADHVGSEIYDLNDALHTPEFLQYAAFIILETADLMQDVSVLFNVAGKERFTNREDMHVVLLSSFANAAEVYLYSNTFHDEFVRLPKAETVTKWQAMGTAAELDDRALIDVKIASDGTAVEIDGVLGVIFDDKAAAVTNEDPRVTTFWNAKGEFQNQFHKRDAQYMNNLEQNCVVFYAFDEE